MNNQPVYIKYNSYRKSKFLLRTEVAARGKRIYIQKVAQSEDSKQFLGEVYRNYSKLKKISLPFTINKLQLNKENILVAEYLEGPSLLKRLEDIFRRDSWEECVELFSMFNSLLRKLPIEKSILNKNYRSVFGNYPKSELYEVITIGLFDLNFDNFIVSENSNSTLNLIDYEWIFNFGIPLRYLLYRTIFNSFFQLRHLNPKKINLKDIESLFNFETEEVYQYLKWEQSFQNYVGKSEFRDNTIFNVRENLIKQIPLRKDSFSDIVESKKIADENINALEERNIELSSQISILNNQVGEYKSSLESLHEYNSFKEGITWKILEKYRAIKGQIHVQRIYTFLRYLSSIRTKEELFKYLRHLKSYISYKFINLVNKQEKQFYKDKVSIGIPIWDRTSELKESIDSILNQSYENLELILVTDGSPPETLEIIRQYENNPKVKIFYYYNNSGSPVRGRNKAIREATGEYFAFQDSDDIADINRIKTSVEYIKKYNIQGVYGGWRAKLDGSRKDTNLTNNQEIFSPDCDIEMMKEICVPCQSTVMINTKILQELGELKTNMKYREDHELWLRFMNNGFKFKSIPKILTNLRIHKGNAELIYKGEDTHWEKELQREYIKETSLKPKIAYIIPSTGIGGGLAVIIQHANRLIQRGYDVILLSTDGNENIKWTECYAQVVSIWTDKRYYFENIDLLIATFYDTVQYLDTIKSTRKAYFVQSDERRFVGKDEIETINRIQETYCKDLEFFTEAIWIQKWLKSEFNKDAYYVPNGLDPKLFYKTKPLKKKGKKTRVLIEGPIDIWFKGMYDAYYSVKDLDVELWIVSSSGAPPTYWRYDKFFEKVPISKMAEIYSSCDIFLKMSRVEGFFGPPLEAMACGCVPIVSKVTGYSEYIVDNENALVVEIGDTDGARKALQSLIDNSELYKKLLRNAQKTVSMWNWERSIDFLEKLIKKESIVRMYDTNTPDYSYKKEIKRIYGKQ
jgi:glycosyltransferase involved in cell wall biosynthesis